MNSSLFAQKKKKSHVEILQNIHLFHLEYFTEVPEKLLSLKQVYSIYTNLLEVGRVCAGDSAAYMDSHHLLRFVTHLR